MPTVKQSIGIAIAIAMAFVAATAFGISVVEQSAPQVATNHFTASKADLGLKDHQRLRRLLVIERPRDNRGTPLANVVENVKATLAVARHTAASRWILS